MGQKTIGVLTSGGDAPGMNAAVRAVVKTAIQKGYKVIGIMNGYEGLIDGTQEVLKEMNVRSVSDIINRGGTVLYTARCPEFKEMAGVLKAKDTCIANDISGIVVIGGDGSFRGAADLSSVGIPCVGIPGTIDNDISCTEYTIGYDTAMNTVIDMIDRLRDTADSHYRCSVVEVMGRRAGHIALNTGIACGATAIVLPEAPISIEDVVEKIEEAKKKDKHHFIVVVAEGVGNTDELVKKIQDTTGIETRATVLGHVQRGGTPTVRDRVVATEMGYHAVDLLANGIGNRVVAMKDGKIVDYDIQEALKMTKEFSNELYDIANLIAF